MATALIGQINQIGGVMIVSQTQSNLEAVDRLLDGIRQSGVQKMPTTPATQAKQIRVRNTMLENMAQTCFDPDIMGIAAVGGAVQPVAVHTVEIIRALARPGEYDVRIIFIDGHAADSQRRKIVGFLYIETGNLPAAREQLKKIIEENDNAPKNPGKNAEPAPSLVSPGK